MAAGRAGTGIFPASPATIGEAIQAAVDGLPDDMLRPFSANEEPPFPRSRAVLGLLADCYRRQIYSSAAVAAAAGLPEFPWPWWEELPDPDAVARFRAENREAIRRCLIAALQFTVKQKISAGALTKSSHPQLAEEASRRIIMAAFADSLEFQGD